MKGFYENLKEEYIMKIGIIVHSQTGHTYSVAQKIEENLLSGRTYGRNRTDKIGRGTTDS